MADDIRVKLGVDAQGALDSIKAFSKQSAESLKTVESAFEGIKLILEVLAVAEVFHLIVEGLGECIAEASKADEAFAKMNVSMKLSGDYTKEAEESFKHLAHSISESTKFSDEAALGALATAKNFGISNEAAEALVKTATDLATVQGVDLNTAVQSLGKTYSGHAKEIARLVPGVKNLTEEQLRSGAAIELIGRRFDGAAEAMTGTYAGALAQSKNKFSELMEAIGQFITQNSVVVAVIKTAGNVFAWLGKYLAENKKAISDFVTNGILMIVNTIPYVIDGFSILANIIGVVVKMVLMATTSIVGFIRAAFEIQFIRDYYAGLARAISLVVFAVISFIEAFAKLPGVSHGLKALGIDTQALSNKLETANENVFKFMTGFKGQDITDTLTKVEQTGYGLVQKTDDVLGSMSSGFGKLKSGAVELSKSLTEIGKANANALEASTDKIRNLSKEIAPLTREMQEALTGGGAKSPFGALRMLRESAGIKTPINPDTQKEYEGTQGRINIGAAFGAASSALGGMKGAENLIQTGLSVVGDKLFPGAGAAIGQIVGVLMQGKDKVKEMIQEFAKSVPTIIKAIITSIPTLIRELVKAIPQVMKALTDSIPEVIDEFINDLPDIIQALVEAMPVIAESMALQSPKIAEGIVRAIGNLIKKAFSGDFVQTIVEGAGRFISEFLKVPAQFLNKLLQGIGDAIKNFLGLSGDKGGILNTGIGGGGAGFGIGGGDSRIAIGTGHGGLGVQIGGWSFAEGGEVPPGFSGDTYPARLSSGEMVLPAKKAETFKQVMGDGVGGGIAAKLDQLIAAMGGGSDKNLTVNMVVGEKQLASTILSLNQRGFRLA